MRVPGEPPTAVDVAVVPAQKEVQRTRERRHQRDVCEWAADEVVAALRWPMHDRVQTRNQKHAKRLTTPVDGELQSRRRIESVGLVQPRTELGGDPPSMHHYLTQTTMTVRDALSVAIPAVALVALFAAPGEPSPTRRPGSWTLCPVAGRSPPASPPYSSSQSHAYSSESARSRRSGSSQPPLPRALPTPDATATQE